MKDKDESIDLEHVKDSMERGLVKMHGRFFSTREKFNTELIAYLDRRSKWKKEIKDLRVKYNVPDLTPKKDLIIPVVYDEKDYGETSSWMHSLDKQTKTELNKDIKRIMSACGMPSFFYQWFEFIVLYRRKPYSSLISLSVPAFSSDLDDFKKHPSTTQDKNYMKYLLKVAKKHFLINTNDKKNHKKMVSCINKLPKNKLRPNRTLKTAIETLSQGKKIDRYDETGGGKYDLHRITYDYLCVKLDEEEKYSGRERLFNQRLRKQKERIKKRINIILPKNKK